MSNIYLKIEKKVISEVPLSRKLTSEEIEELKNGDITIFDLEEGLLKWEEEEISEEDHSGKLEYVNGEGKYSNIVIHGSSL